MSECIYKLAVLGCGAIFNRHLSAILANNNYYQLIGVYDCNQELQKKCQDQLKVKGYASEDEMYQDQDINCIVILTPSGLHYKQIKCAINAGKHVIVEKPPTLKADQILELDKLSSKLNLNIFTILQVRLNRSVMIVKKFIELGHFGNVRGFNLVQCWQRPASYFSGWRGSLATGGGILSEFAIHYLDVLTSIFGKPRVISAKGYNNKFTHCDVNDTIYTIFDYGKFGGVCEISIAAEPRNIRCGLTLVSDRGFIELGGKSLDEIISAEFLDPQISQEFLQIKEEVESVDIAGLAQTGVSPFHPECYRQLIINPDTFKLISSYQVVSLVENIYKKVSNG
jgi:UDP-N-acetyl-2-amino-2-deoxyglucuronate dehydrogenase